MNHQSRLTRLIGLGTLGLLLSGCAGSPMRPPVGEEVTVEEAYINLSKTEKDIANQWAGKSFEEFEATVYREPGGGKYIVNGDTPIVDRKHLREFFENEVQRTGPPVMGLTVMVEGGIDAVWDQTTRRHLTYCVSTTFGSRYDTVLEAMVSAGDAWESVADIDFIHDASEDDDCTASNDQVLFDVRPVSGASYLARAFFPNDARSQRNVLIDNSAFETSGNLTLTGILRHELGHTLGFRHEHTRPEAGECFEDENWRPVTDYDALSVMHYPQCNGAGDWTLTLTSFDQNGAACLYGAAPGFSINPSICQAPDTPPDPCGEQQVELSGELAQGEVDRYGPYAVAPGSKFSAVMSGSGDPDLYVRFRLEPQTSSGNYDCRPYLSGASESCKLTAPTGATEAFVMVRGYNSGSYNLTILHTPAQ